MTLPPNDPLKDMARELDTLRAALAEIRGQQAQRATRHRWRFRIGLLTVLLIVATSWAWSAQASNPIPPEIEKRLHALESLIRKDKNNTLQMTAPLDVIGPNGKSVLHVNEEGITVTGSNGSLSVIAGGDVAMFNAKGLGMVGIEMDDDGGKVAVWNKQGKRVVEMSTGGRDGLGGLVLSDAKGEYPQTIVGAGAVALFNKKGTQVAGIEALGEGGGEVAVWSGDKKVAVLGATVSGKEGHGRLDLSNSKGGIEAMIVGGSVLLSDGKGNFVASMGVEGEDSNATGAVTVMNSKGKDIARMSADKGTNAGKLSIMNAEGKPVVGLIGGEKGGGTVAVTNSTSTPLAQMSVSNDGGRGMFQVNKNQKPVALLTEAIERPGGLLQIFNTDGPVANVTVSQKGAGYWQLTNAAGLPTVEAGTTSGGEGAVLAGPFYGCVPITASLPTPLIQPGVGIPDCIKGSATEGRAGKYLK